MLESASLVNLSIDIFRMIRPSRSILKINYMNDRKSLRSLLVKLCCLLITYIERLITDYDSFEISNALEQIVSWLLFLKEERMPAFRW